MKIYQTLKSLVGWSVICSLVVGIFDSRPAAAQTADEPVLAALPADFTDSLVASLSGPTALAFTPDGRMLITTQSGKLRVYASGALLTNPALDLSAKLCSNSERGLLGVTVDPSFASNRFIYLYYTFKKNGVCTNNSPDSPVNRVSRFILQDSNVVDPASEVVFIDNVPSPNGNHNAGDLAFGRDGFLYISVGDGGCDYADSSKCAGSNDAARDQHILLGKILRITREGGIPPANPYQGADSARCHTTGRTTAGKKCQETFAWGLRNPFRLAFDPNVAETRFLINDVGQNAWEEIDLGQAGADYGWNVREGHCATGSTSNCGAPPAGMTNPIYDYGRGGGCGSITGGAVVPNGLWPAAYDNSYLYGDYVCGKIFKLSPAGGGGFTVTEFMTGLGANSAVHLSFGPSAAGQSLYYTTYANGGQVRRIDYVGNNNRPPTAVATANPTSGPAPLTVNFDGSGSSDPDGDPLTYEWDFGDGATGTGMTTAHTYSAVGNYTASLRVRDNRGGVSTPATVQISVGNTPPTPTITSPAPNLLFYVGQSITLTGSATDAQDGPLPDSSLSWRVILHHNDHTHPFLQPTSGNNLVITAPAPEDLAATTTSYLEIELTATDSQGLSSVITQALRPHLVDVTFATNPAGLRLEVNSTLITGPQTITSWEAYALNVNAPAQTDGSGQSWVFSSWSDGGGAAHTITTPASATTYTATFTPAPPGAGGGLSGQYYDNRDLTNLKVTRTDPTVDFDWGEGSPDPSILTDTFSVRWTGQVQPLYSETYTFYTLTNDGVRLWVNGQLLIDKWIAGAGQEYNATINLTTGQKYDLKMEYFEKARTASAKLMWSSPSQPKQVIPQSRLYPSAPPTAFSAFVNFQPASAPVPSGYVADGGAVYGNRGNGLTYGWNQDISAHARDRNAANSPDQRYDTLNHMQKSANPNAFWEIAVPNGTYRVRVVMGDPIHADSVYRLNVEGVLAVQGTPTSSTRWFEGTVTLTVTDGRLTLTNGSGASNNRICFVEITQQ